jgi:hypothetical protein
LAIARLGAAERSYIAGGQGLDYWTTRVTSILADLEPRLQRLQSLSEGEAAQQSVQSARSILGDFGTLDRTIREHLDADQRMLASDLIFTDAVQLLDQASEQLVSARESSASLVTDRIAAARREETWWLGSAAAAAGLALLLMAWAPARSSPTKPAPATDAENADLLLVPRTLAAPSGGPKPTSVTDIAQVCAELARVSRPGELDAVLDRTAALLGARGIVLWLAGENGAELRPAIARGYPPEAVSRLGFISTAAENATAAAFRNAVLVTVPAAGGPYGALVAPMIGASGCTGVLSIEVPDGFERDPHAQALATILSAQLSGLVTGDTSATSAPVQAQA